MRAFITATVATAAIVLVACGQSPSTSNGTGMTCIERLTVPRYPPIASSTRLSFPNFVVSVHLGTDSTVQSISVEAPPDQRGLQKLFLQAVESAVRASAFRPECRGRVINLGFDFRLSDRMEDDGRVIFHSPNRFEVFDTRPTINFDASRP